MAPDDGLIVSRNVYNTWSWYPEFTSYIAVLDGRAFGFIGSVVLW